MLHVRRLKKKPSVAPKKKRVASLLLRNPLRPKPLRLQPRQPNPCVKARRSWQQLQHLRPILASATNSVVRTSHVPTTTVGAVAMASAKTLLIVLRSRKRRQRHERGRLRVGSHA